MRDPASWTTLDSGWECPASKPHSNYAMIWMRSRMHHHQESRRIIKANFSCLIYSVAFVHTCFLKQKIGRDARKPPPTYKHRLVLPAYTLESSRKHFRACRHEKASLDDMCLSRTSRIEWRRFERILIGCLEILWYAICFDFSCSCAPGIASVLS
ncbi:hypothetical protein AB1N83_006224 [Pleurotus pulmonarius]